MEKRKETEPFTELEKTDLKGITSKLFTVPGYEDMVVRKSFVNVNDPEMNIHERSEYLHNKVVEFKKIVGRLGIHMANTDYVIGIDPNMNRPALFGVTERIEGKNLKEMTFFDKELADNVDEMYTRIISDLIDSYKKEHSFWCDPKNEQFIFGKAEGDKKSDIYLVDVDPDILNWKDVAMEDRESIFWNRLEWILSAMEDAEKKVYEKDFRFKKAREAMEKAKMEIFNVI